jgi:hypothetical protein
VHDTEASLKRLDERGICFSVEANVHAGHSGVAKGLRNHEVEAALARSCHLHFELRPKLGKRSLELMAQEVMPRVNAAIAKEKRAA